MASYPYPGHPSPERPPPNSLLVHVQFDHRFWREGFDDKLQDKLCIYFQKNQVSKGCDVKEVSLAGHDIEGSWMNVTFSDPAGVQHSLEVESHVLSFDGQSFPLKVMQPPPQSPAVPSYSSLVSVFDEPFEDLMEYQEGDSAENHENSPKAAEIPSRAETQRDASLFQKGILRNAASLTAPGNSPVYTGAGEAQGCTSEMPPRYSPNDSSSTEEYWDPEDYSPDMYGVIEEEFDNQKPSNVIKSPQPQERNTRGMGRGITYKDNPSTSQPQPGRDNWKFTNISQIPGGSPGPSVSNANPPNQDQRKRRGSPNWAAGNAPFAPTHPTDKHHQQQGQKSKTKKYPGSAAPKYSREPDPSTYRGSEEEKENESDTEKEVVMVEVSNFKSSTSDDMLKLYFENRKSGGGDIKMWERDAKTGTIIRFTYENPSLAASVSKRTHKVDGAKLTVKQVIKKPPKPSTDRGSEEMKENESDTEEEVVMVEVSNFKSSTSDDMLKLYFENRKSGGGDINTWERDAKTGTIIRFTYENPSLATSVAKKTHKVDGAKLTVKQVIKKPPRPRPVKKCCLFLSGIPDGCSAEHLSLFLENRSRLDEPTIQYGEMPGTAICTFSEEIPDKVIDRICSKKIQEVNLTAERVHESDCILVQGFSSGTSLDLIELYFDNKKKSGGGGVREVEQGPADGQAVVYFEDWKAVGDVLSTGKLHKLQGQLLSVEEYHSNIGCLSPLDAPTPHIPKPVSVQVPVEIMEFISGKGKNTKVKLMNELKKVHAVLYWPDGSNKSSARLEPLEDQQRQSSWLKWPENSQKVLKDFLGSCKSAKIPIPPPFWNEVIDKIKQLDSRGYSIEEDAQRHTVQLAGEQGDVNKGLDDISKIIRDLKAKAEHDAQQIKQDLPLQPLKLQQVILCGIKDKMETDFPSLKISIQHSAAKRGLLLEGPRKNVQEAELFMRRQMDNLEHGEINTGKNKALLIQNVSDKIHEIFGSSNILAMCSVTQDGRIVIYGAKKVDVINARAFIDQEITETEIRVEGQAALSVLKNPEGRKLFDDINKQTFAQVRVEHNSQAGVQHSLEVESHVLSFDGQSFPLSMIKRLQPPPQSPAVPYDSSLMSEIDEPFEVVQELSENESDEEEEIVMVEVSNFKLSTSDDMLKLYFENRRHSGGGDIKMWERDAKTGTVIRFTYENPSLATSVAKRTHKVDGAKLTVKQVIKKPPRPRPVKKCCLFLSGIPDGCSTEHLSIFLDIRSGLDEPTIQYGEMPGTAICTFSKEIPDFDKVIDRICSKKIQNVNLTAEKVHESDCILVQGFSSGTTLDLIEFYFENKKKSGGGEVREVEQRPVDGQAVVYFEDWKVVGDVLSTGKRHKLSGELLRVEEYHSNFGRLSPLDAPTPHIPKPVSVQVPAEIMEFISGKGKNTKVKLVNELKKVHAVLHWPDGNNKSSARLEPLEDQQRQSSWLKWPENSQKVLKDFLRYCKSAKIPIPPPFWNEVIDKIKQLDSRGYSIEEDAQRHTVHLAGEQGDVNKGSDDIYKIIRDLKAKAELDAQQIIQDVPMQPLKLQQVILCGIKDKMEKDFPGLKIGIQTSAGKRGLLLDGPRKNVQEAELFMRRELDNLEQGEINTGKNKAVLIRNVSDKIHEMLGSQNILAMCSVTQDGRIMIYGAKKVDVTKARAYIGQEITETEIRVEGQAAIFVLQKPEGMKLFDDINKQKFVQVELVSQAGRIELAGFKTNLEEKKRKIVEFLKDNVILKKLVPANKNTMILINSFYGKTITDLMTQHTKNHIAIKSQMSSRNKGFVIQGNQEGVEGTSQAIVQLVGGVKEQQYPVSMTGMAQLFRDDKGKKFLEFTEKELECVIRESGLDEESDDEDDDEESDDEDDDASRRGAKPHAVATEVPAGPNILLTNEGIKITLKKGSITNQTVDVLVNTAGSDMKLNHGAVAKALLQAAGLALQQECDTVTASRGGQIPAGSFIETGAGVLACKKIYHCVCSAYQQGESEQFLRKLVKSIMEQAEMSEMLSIAIPALGTGNLHYPGDVTARVMYDAILDFSQRYPTGVLKDVRFVVYDKDVKTIKAFEDEIQRLITGLSPGAVGGATGGAPVGKRKLKKSKSTTPSNPQAYSSVQQMRTGELQTKIGSVCLQVAQGDLVRETTNAIVNSVGPGLDLQGPVSKAILAGGGFVIAKECDAFRKKGIKLVYVTGSGNLPCDAIFHVCTPATAEEIKIAVGKVLQQAEDKKMKSMSFPALGTGQRSTLSTCRSVDNCAGAMLSAIGEFAVRKKPQYLLLIRLVIFQQDMLPGFHQALHKEVGTSYKEEKSLFSKGVAAAKSAWNAWSGTASTEEEEIPQETMILNICAMSMATLQKATKKIDEFQKQESASEDVPDVHGLFDKMSVEHQAQVKAIEKKNHVGIEIDRQAVGKVMHVQGCVLDVKNARIEIQELFTQMQMEENEAQRREHLAKQVQWKYSTPNGMEPYNPKVNALIEEAHAKNWPSVHLYLKEGPVTVDFRTKQEVSTNSTLVVQRVDLLKAAVFEAPINWVPLTGNKHFAMATLNPGTAEYISVQAQFDLTMTGSYTQINEIQRVQNQDLMMQYQARRTAMEARLARTNVEMSLFHGTDNHTCEKINKFGYNRSYCGKNATAFGNGTYFAVQANYSSQDKYAKPNASGIKHMYLTKVLVGDYTRGNLGMLAPPVKPSSPDQLYDSVVDNVTTPSIYVIFHDAQAYPEYLIKFQ